MYYTLCTDGKKKHGMSKDSKYSIFEFQCLMIVATLGHNNILQSNFSRSNSPVSNTRDRSNSFVGPGNFPIHLMLKYTPGSNSDGSNSKQGPQGDFSCKNAMMARTKYFFT